jgi:hypothetical protein
MFLIDAKYGLRVMRLNLNSFAIKDQFNKNLYDLLSDDGISKDVVFSHVKIVDQASSDNYTLIITTHNHNHYEVNLTLDKKKFKNSGNFRLFKQ